MIVFISGPYRGKTKEIRNNNIDHARDIALDLWNRGFVALCPHLNTIMFDEDLDIDDAVYLQGDRDILARCDAILMIEGWENSSGALLEKETAEALGIPVYYEDSYKSLMEISRTEQTSPVQCSAFINTVMKMYRVHLAKNADYSPANILGTGMIGLVTRIWDKVARLMNLHGFRFHIVNEAFEEPMEPKNESIDDNLSDLAVYSVIAQIYRDGSWGI